MWDMIVGVGLAAAGRLSKMLSQKDKRLLTVFNIFSELFVAAVLAIAVLLMMQWANVDSDAARYLTCLVAGWIGSKVMDAISKETQKRLNLKLDEDAESSVVNQSVPKPGDDAAK